MRILTISDHLGPGGRQRTAQDYTLGYLDAGCAVALLAVRAGGPRLEPLRDRGVPVFVGGLTPEAQLEAAARAATWEPDVIHLHSPGFPHSDIARAVEHLKARLPEPGTVPVLETTSFGTVDFARHFQLTDVYLLKARWALWRWRKWGRALRPRPLGVVVPNTVDPATFYPSSEAEREAFRRRHGLPPGAFVFGCVARPDPLKWPPVLFRAFAEVAAAHPCVYFVVAGLAEAARPAIAALPSGVRRRVVELPFLGNDDDLRACYGAMDVFLHASPIGESFGLVFIEALLCGAPVVTLSTPAKSNSQLEVVGHERGGLIANDRRGMVEAMERLLADEPLRRRLARDGAAHVRANYTLEQVIPRLLRVARMAREAPTREALAAALEADPDLTTEVSDAEMETLLRNTIGRVPLRQRALMRLAHAPCLIRVWWALTGLAERGKPPVPKS
jgi:glycosyltransferase involved in cell wall biosynthesis